MNLKLHLALHVLSALLAGFIVWRIWKKPLTSFVAGILGGVLVDLDHFFDYFLTFGFHFNLAYFNRGDQFLKSDRILVLFHAWEYVFILLVLVFMIKNRVWKSFLLALAIGLFFHLCLDVKIDHMPVKSYSIAYRLEHNFKIEPLIYPEHYAEHVKRRLEAGFN